MRIKQIVIYIAIYHDLRKGKLFSMPLLLPVYTQLDK